MICLLAGLLILMTVAVVMTVDRGEGDGSTEPETPTGEVTTGEVTTSGDETTAGDETTDEATTEEATTEEETTEEATTEYKYPTYEEFTPNYTYISDITPYAAYLNPNDDAKYLVLVNKVNTVDKYYVPTDLVNLPSTFSHRTSNKLCEYAAKAAEALFTEFYAAGNSTAYKISTSYRDYSYQSSLYFGYIDEEQRGISADAYAALGEAYIKENYTDKGLTKLNYEDAVKVVNTYSAYPGTSEHQTGLCFDMRTASGSLTNAFANTNEYKWLVDNAYKFGFVLRFPDDKTATTGYAYESWHWRFVGQYHAYMMHELDMCLEEYTEYLKTNP